MSACERAGRTIAARERALCAVKRSGPRKPAPAKKCKRCERASRAYRGKRASNIAYGASFAAGPSLRKERLAYIGSKCNGFRPDLRKCRFRGFRHQPTDYHA